MYKLQKKNPMHYFAPNPYLANLSAVKGKPGLSAATHT